MAPELIRAEADPRGLDLALMAALIRQGSGFEPRAVSRVGALGLVQVMPEVGRQLATARKFPRWDRALLLRPDANVRLGTAHLAEPLGGNRHVAYALAAYDAGATPVKRWRARPGTADPETFVERIPYAETRDHARIVQRKPELYRALHPAAENPTASN